MGEIKIMKLAIVHEILAEYGGAERTLEAVHRVWPEAPVFTLLYNQAAFGDKFKGWDIRTSPLQNSLLESRWRVLRPVMPVAIESLDLREFDVVLSFSSAFAHGVLTRPDQLHINYYHAPMRFAWDYNQEYLDEHHLRHGLMGTYIRNIIHKLRVWDMAAAERPDIILANSQTTAKRIEHYYRRSVDKIINPPVELSELKPAKERGDYFLVLSRLSPYKRVDLAIEACKILGQKLIVVGDGSERARLEQLGGNKTEFKGFVSEAEKRGLLMGARALIFPVSDDFGIVPVEAMSCGVPVIAYKEGGVLETVAEGKSGLFFAKPTANTLAKTLNSFMLDESKFHSAQIARHAKQWSADKFEKKLKELVESEYAQRTK